MGGRCSNLHARSLQSLTQCRRLFAASISLAPVVHPRQHCFRWPSFIRKWQICRGLKIGHPRWVCGMWACSIQVRARSCTSHQCRTSNCSCISTCRNCFTGCALTIHLISCCGFYAWSALQNRHVQCCWCRRVRSCWHGSPKTAENGKHQRQNHQKTNDHRCRNDAPAIFQTFNIAALQLKQAQGARNGSDVLTPHKKPLQDHQNLPTHLLHCWKAPKLTSRISSGQHWASLYRCLQDWCDHWWNAKWWSHLQWDFVTKGHGRTSWSLPTPCRWRIPLAPLLSV